MRQSGSGEGREDRERRRERQTISHEEVESQRGKGHPKGDLLHRGIRQRENKEKEEGERTNHCGMDLLHKGIQTTKRNATRSSARGS